MLTDRHRDFALDIWGVALLVPLLFLPILSDSFVVLSLTYQIAIGAAAAMGIYVMLRTGLLSFTVPTFMAVGGYAAAILAKAGVTDIFSLMAISLIAPMVVALPLGAIVLRLKGIYFIFITFIINEILQLVIFETPGLTGGADGITNVPSATLLGFDFNTPKSLAVVTVVVCLIATLFSLAVTQRFRPEFTSIDENETLSQSLGVAVWKYRMIGFITSAGVSGLAGFAMVNMLATAHPSSFTSWSVNSYIAYAFVGGRGTILGVLVGSFLLITMSNIFSAYAQYSQGLYGILLILVMMTARGGIVGTLVNLVGKRKIRKAVDAKHGDAAEVKGS